MLCLYQKITKNEYCIDDTSDKGELSSRENYSKTSGDGDLPKGDKAVFWFYHLLCEYGNWCAHESDVGSGVILCVRCRSKADARSADSRTDVEGNPPLILGALIMMTCTTSVSLSLEGKICGFSNRFQLRRKKSIKEKCCSICCFRFRQH